MLAYFPKVKLSLCFIEKFHKHNETSGETNTYMNEVFRQRTRVKSSLFFQFVRGYLECLFPTGGDGFKGDG